MDPSNGVFRPRTSRQAKAPIDAGQLRARARCVLEDCRRASANDLAVAAVIDDVIAEITSLAEGVLAVMPADAQTLTDELAEAYAVLVRLVEDVEHACGAIHALRPSGASPWQSDLMHVVTQLARTGDDVARRRRIDSLSAPLFDPLI